MNATPAPSASLECPAAVRPADISESLRHLTAVAGHLRGSIRQLGFYDGVFADYVEDLNAGVDWDGRLLDAALRDSGVAPNAHIVDLCCGSGRIGSFLADRGFTVTGVDCSTTLLDRAPRARPGRRVRWIQADLGRDDFVPLVGGPVAAAVVSAASVNCFADAGRLVEALGAGVPLLRAAPGVLLVPLFDDGARARFEDGFPDRLIGHPLRFANGRQLVVWTSLGYHPPTATLHQAALVTVPDPSGLVHHYTYNVDRIWTASEVSEILRDAGWTPVLSRAAAVEGGGADSFPFRLLGFRPPSAAAKGRSDG